VSGPGGKSRPPTKLERRRLLHGSLQPRIERLGERPKGHPQAAHRQTYAARSNWPWAKAPSHPQTTYLMESANAMDARDLIDEPTSLLTVSPPGVVYMFKDVNALLRQWTRSPSVIIHLAADLGCKLIRKKTGCPSRKKIGRCGRDPIDMRPVVFAPRDLWCDAPTQHRRCERVDVTFRLVPLNPEAPSYPAPVVTSREVV
jgi:hypothetical protein